VYLRNGQMALGAIVSTEAAKRDNLVQPTLTIRRRYAWLCYYLCSLRPLNTSASPEGIHARFVALDYGLVKIVSLCLVKTLNVSSILFAEMIVGVSTLLQVVTCSKRIKPVLEDIDPNQKIAFVTDGAVRE
jgi:hypothetical protein